MEFDNIISPKVTFGMLTHSESLLIRRSNLAGILPNNSIFVILSSQTQIRNSDVDWPFRQNSDFWYLTGIDEDQSALVICKDREDKITESLFVSTKTEEEQIWTGPVLGIEESSHISGIKDVAAWDSLITFVDKQKLDGQTLYFDLEGSYQSLRDQIRDKLYLKTTGRNGKVITTLTKTSTLTRQLRLHKDEFEIAEMQESARINIEAHHHAYSVIQSKLDSGQKVYEYQFQAELELIWRRQNCTWSYYPIVASGNSATTLHYNQNNRVINPDQFLLVDAGCEYNYYSSDITRCYHFGHPTEAQSQIYNLVKKANIDCIEHIASGNVTAKSFHKVAVETLTAGLIELRILNGSLESNLETRSYSKYFMHGAGHYLGLDVHDAGIYTNDDGTGRILDIGTCVTVEPGLYFNNKDQTVPEQYRGIGIRIEDNIIKTENGILNLTEGLEK